VLSDRPNPEVKLPRAYSSTGFSRATPSAPETYVYNPIHDNTKVSYKVQDENVTTTSSYSEQNLFESSVTAVKHQHRYVGEALGTYILAEKDNSLWLIDKHAAHERINFDRLKDRKQVTMSQTLVHPVIIELGREDTALLSENRSLFEQLGFFIEAFGETALAVREIPSEIEMSDIESILGEMARILHHGGSPDSGLILDELMHSIACKAAIKAGRRSEPLELETLIDRVLSGEIRYCPHGRPVAIELTKTTLDRNFKRT